MTKNAGTVNLFQSCAEGNEQSLKVVTESLIKRSPKDINYLKIFEVISYKTDIHTFFYKEVENYFSGTYQKPWNDKNYNPKKDVDWNFLHSHKRGWASWIREVNRCVGKESNNHDFEFLENSQKPFKMYGDYEMSEVEKEIIEIRKQELLKQLFEYLGTEKSKHFEAIKNKKPLGKSDYMFLKRLNEEAEKFGKKHKVNIFSC